MTSTGKEPETRRPTTGNRPRPLADLVPSMAQGMMGRKNLLFGKLLADWGQIAGADIAAHTLPLDLKPVRSGGKADKRQPQVTLHLAVQSAFALELSYQKSVLIERLNVYFGYGAVKDIKIIQHSEVMNNKKFNPPKTRHVTLTDEKKIEGAVKDIQENDLQEALKNLGKAILSRQE